jgi:hypothetical protein
VAPPTGRRAIALGSAAGASDRRRDGADATLVEATVTARLLGLRILTLDATVVLVPADVGLTPPVVPVRRRTAHPPARSTGAPPRREVPAGHRLADAIRTLDEGSRLLAQVQRDGA